MHTQTTAEGGEPRGLRLLVPISILASLAAAVALGVRLAPPVDPTGRLRWLASECDRVVVAPSSEDESRIDLTTRADIDRFVDLLVLEPETRSPCKCIGDATIDFFRGPSLRLALTFHHGEGLRCRGSRAPRAWMWDAVVVPSARLPLARRLAEAGITAPLDELTRAERDAAAKERNPR